MRVCSRSHFGWVLHLIRTWATTLPLRNPSNPKLRTKLKGEKACSPYARLLLVP